LPERKKKRTENRFGIPQTKKKRKERARVKHFHESPEAARGIQRAYNGGEKRG